MKLLVIFQIIVPGGSLPEHLLLGKSERLVGLVKRSLHKGIEIKRLTLDQFVFILAEVEAIYLTIDH